MGLNLVVLLEE